MEKNEIRIYVGRWDMLPAEWEGIQGLDVADEGEVKREVERQHSILATNKPHSEEECDYVGVYTPEVFEAEFNYDLQGFFTTQTYWIKIF